MRRRWTSLYFDPHDLWVGAYWKWAEIEMVLPKGLWPYGKPATRFHCLSIYICIIPCCVLCIRRIVGEEITEGVADAIGDH